MELFGRAGQREARAELAEDRGGVVALNRQAAAFRRTVGCEGGEDDVASGAECRCGLLDVERAVFGRGQEVKDGAVVPEAEALLREFGGEEIGTEKVDASGSGAEASARVVQSLLRDIQHGEVGVAGGEEVIDKRGFAGADVEDRCGEIKFGAADEGERGLEVRTEPAPLGSGFGRENLLPVLLGTAWVRCLGHR